MKQILQNGKIIHLNDEAKSKCIVIDTNKDRVDQNIIETISDKTLLYVLIAIGILNLIKK